MTDDDDRYAGREHSRIKHAFLKAYLEAASFKVLQGSSARDTFTYVDGFAGPWSVADETDYSDASFDNALRVLFHTRDFIAKQRGLAPKLRFLLCERDQNRFERLSKYAERKSGVFIKVFQGNFEDNLDQIRANCAGFTFTFVDPKGWDLRSNEIAQFLSSLNGEFLLNFMEHPISRHNSYQGVRNSFARLLADDDWESKLVTSPSAPARERQILNLLRSRLRELGAAKYMPHFPIKRPDKDRVQMRLVLGTSHHLGVEVFRSVQSKMEVVQVESRRTLAEKKSGQTSLFDAQTSNDLDLGDDKVGSAQNVLLAREASLRAIGNLQTAVSFAEFAASIMEDVSVRSTHIKDVLVKLRKENLVAFDLIGTAKKPNDDTLIAKPKT